jgi:hypothetical protein
LSREGGESNRAFQTVRPHTRFVTISYHVKGFGLASPDKSLHCTTWRIRYIHDHDQQHHNAQCHHMRAQLEAVWLGAESPLTIHRAQPHRGLRPAGSATRPGKHASSPFYACLDHLPMISYTQAEPVEGSARHWHTGRNRWKTPTLLRHRWGNLGAGRKESSWV